LICEFVIVALTGPVKVTGKAVPFNAAEGLGEAKEIMEAVVLTVPLVASVIPVKVTSLAPIALFDELKAQLVENVVPLAKHTARTECPAKYDGKTTVEADAVQYTPGEEALVGVAFVIEFSAAKMPGVPFTEGVIATVDAVPKGLADVMVPFPVTVKDCD